MVNKLRDGDRVAIVNSSTSVYSLNGFTKESAISYLNSMSPGGNGNLAQRLSRANIELSSNGNSHRQRVIVLFSAGYRLSQYYYFNFYRTDFI